MGRAGKVVDEDGDELLDAEERSGDSSESQPEVLCTQCGRAFESDEMFCPKCGSQRPVGNCATRFRNSRTACCCICLVSFALIVGLSAWCIRLYMDSWTKFGVETVGSSLLGVPVSVESVSISLMEGRASIARLSVASPEGYKTDIFDLGRFVFDIGPLSALKAWLTDFSTPMVIEEVTIYDCGVSIEAKGFAMANSNAQEIVDHLNDATMKISPEINKEVMHPDMPDAKTAANEGVKAMEVRLRVDKVRLHNISVMVTLEPMAPIQYTLPRVELKDVGKEGNGVYLYEFMEVLVRALLMAVIKAAPANIQANLASAFGKNLWKELDYVGLQFDSGNGMEKIGEFTGWVSKEAALLPLRIAEQSAALGVKATGIGARITGEALNVGAQLTNAATQAQVAATTGQAALGLKAMNTFGQIGTAFTNGFTKAMTSR
mmetsp:Transcript_58605/g.115227  ORF Transcript_58605/g.115227 Transcript_58605/m.115227 type:complete len:433 (-) Transcript_58605:121-1419(-)